MGEPDHEKLRRELESAATAARAGTPPRRPVLKHKVLIGLLAAVPVTTAVLLAVNAMNDDPTPDPAGNTGAAPDEPGLPPQPPRSSTARPPATSTGPDVPPAPEPTPGPTPGPRPGSDPTPDRAAAHTVAEGETLARIAGRYGVPLEQIAEHNGITDPDLIQVGQHLDIPDAGPDQIVIEPGATLSGYAEQYGTTVSALVALNPQITDPDDIISGGRLRLR